MTGEDGERRDRGGGQDWGRRQGWGDGEGKGGRFRPHGYFKKSAPRTAYRIPCALQAVGQRIVAGRVLMAA